MKITVLGSGASEGVPAFLCKCEACKRAERLGGKEIRRRAGVLVNDDLLIDFSPDIYMHRLNYSLDFGKLRGIVLTHEHCDHFNPWDMENLIPPVYSKREPYPLPVYGPSEIGEWMTKVGIGSAPTLPFIEINDGMTFKIPDTSYTVTALKTQHDTRIGCYVYVITDGKSTYFHGHDSGMYTENVWEGLKKCPRINMALIDCVWGLQDCYQGHMGFPANIKVRERMLSEGIADEATVFVSTHFSHNAVSAHTEMEEKMALHGYEPAYDGMKKDI